MAVEQNEKSPDAYARQTFNLRRWIESTQRPARAENLPQELIDNALDASIEGVCLHTSISYHPDEKRISVKHTGTEGMGPERLQRFTQWAREREGEEVEMGETYGEHGMGAKIVELLAIDEQEGSVRYRSKPQGSDEAYRMEMGRWWQRLEPDEEFPIFRDTPPEWEGDDWTAIEMEGVRDRFLPTPKGLVELAQRLGVVYGPKIERGEMSISLRRVKKGKVDKVEVKPTTVRFKEEREQGLPQTSENVPLGEYSDAPRARITWGRVDTERTEGRDIKESGDVNGLQQQALPGGNAYIRVRGRLLEQKPLEQIDIPRWTRKWSMEQVGVVADVTEGEVRTNILKTKLSPTDPTTDALYRKISDKIALLVKEIASEARDRDRIPENVSRRAEQASEALQTALNRLFDGDIERLAEELDIPLVEELGWDESQYTSEEDEAPTEGSTTKETPTRLPKRTRLLKRHSPADRDRKEDDLGDKTLEVSGKLENSLPRFVVSSDPNELLPAFLSLDDHGRPVISINYNSRAKDVLAMRNRGQRTKWLLEVGARVLFQNRVRKELKQRGLGATSSEWEELSDGVEEDVSRLIKAYEESES